MNLVYLRKSIALKYIRVALILLILMNKVLVFAQTNHPLVVSGNIQLTNNGTAPVPLFALGRPAIMSAATFRKGNFYFNPELNFGMDLKPWMVNTRYGYYLVDNKEMTIGLAATPSLFFLQRNPLLNKNEEFQLQRYVGYELNGEYRMRKDRKLQYQYWHSVCLDKLGIENEDFVSLAFVFESMPINEKNFISWRPSLFYLHDHMTMEGFFASQTTNFQQAAWKFNIFVQTTVPIQVSPKSDFIWNTGINIPF